MLGHRRVNPGIKFAGSLHNKLRPSSRTSVKPDKSFRNDDKHDNRDDCRHGDEFSGGGNQASENTVYDPLNESQANIQNDSFKSDTLKVNTPELSTDMLNALADTVAERLKTTLQHCNRLLIIL